MSEIFFSVQGEGPLIGIPSTFLRLSLCNLKCDFCDSKYSWEEEETISVQEVVKTIHNFNSSQVCITGGEPMLAQKEIIEVIEELLELSPFYEFTIETNGTIAPEDRLLELVDTWMVSPKKPYMIDEKFLAKTEKRGSVHLKFVVDNIRDLEEIDKFNNTIGLIEGERFLMPQATTVEEHNDKLPFIIEHAKWNCYRVTPRLQILAWGNRRGV